MDWRVRVYCTAGMVLIHLSQSTRYAFSKAGMHP